MYYDLAEGERFVDEKSDILRVGRYTLKVDSINTRDNKNNFLTQRVSMINCENSNESERLAVKYKVISWEEKELVTSEMRNYSGSRTEYLKLKQDFLIRDIIELPKHFLTLGVPVKKRLIANQRYFNSSCNKHA